MSPENEESYALCVVSAEMTASYLGKSPKLYVEIRLDGSAKQHTTVIKGDTSPQWNQDFRVRGNTFSIISLSVHDKRRRNRDRCIGRVTIQLDTLLDTCSDDKCMYDEDSVVYMYLTCFP